MSSTDGYCSIVRFQEGELGKVFKNNKDKSYDFSSSTERHETDKSATGNGDKKTKQVSDVLIELDNDAMDVDITKSRLLDEAPKGIIEKSVLGEQKTDEGSQDIQLVYTETNDTEMTAKRGDNAEATANKPKIPQNVADSPKAEARPILTVKTPRRVKLITISSPKRRKND